LLAGGRIVYELSLDGVIMRTSTVHITFPGAQDELSGAVPNPFNPQTVVSFSIDHDGHVEMGVFDLTGRRVAVLADRWFSAGTHELSWRGLDTAGNAMPSGVYFVQMRTDRTTTAKKITLLR
jgi:hypothetical protein